MIVVETLRLLAGTPSAFQQFGQITMDKRRNGFFHGCVPRLLKRYKTAKMHSIDRQ